MVRQTTASMSEMTCPECQGQKCEFCNYKGKIYYYPSKNALSYIEIARAKYRIKQN